MSMQLEHKDHIGKGAKFPLQILLPDLTSPLNVGGFFRLADALGISKLYFAGETPMPPNHKIKKTSRSTESYIPFEKMTNVEADLKQMQKDGFTIICLEICSESNDIEQLPSLKDKRVCLIMGAENHGVAQAYLDLADYVCHIPMQGINSSMNVVTAAAIASYTIINKMK